MCEVGLLIFAQVFWTQIGFNQISETVFRKEVEMEIGELSDEESISFVGP